MERLYQANTSKKKKKEKTKHLKSYTNSSQENYIAKTLQGLKKIILR